MDDYFFRYCAVACFSGGCGFINHENVGELKMSKGCIVEYQKKLSKDQIIDLLAEELRDVWRCDSCAYSMPTGKHCQVTGAYITPRDSACGTQFHLTESDKDKLKRKPFKHLLLVEMGIDKDE